MNLPLEQARFHALGSTKNVLDLAVACQSRGSLVKIEFVSTVGVGGIHSYKLREDWKDFETTYHNTYEQSKAEAEDLIKDYLSKFALPLTVHRPSMVVGHSKTGKTISPQVFYYITEFLSGRWTLGVLPLLGQRTLDTIPVDLVARCLLASSNDPSQIGRIVHLSSGLQAISLKNLQSLVTKTHSKEGSPFLFNIPAFLFRIVLLNIVPLFSNSIKKKKSSFKLFLDYLSDGQYFQNNQTQMWYAKNHTEPWPSPEGYLPAVLEGLKAKNTQSTDS